MVWTPAPNQDFDFPAPGQDFKKRFWGNVSFNTPLGCNVSGGTLALDPCPKLRLWHPALDQGFKTPALDQNMSPAEDQEFVFIVQLCVVQITAHVSN